MRLTIENLHLSYTKTVTRYLKFNSDLQSVPKIFIKRYKKSILQFTN
jgi:hypothetical protein